jgi:PIN domain nuclease of toxin-antitoxin system
MKLLLDTQAFIWWDSHPEKLSPSALALCKDPGNILALSVASLWEMQNQTEHGRVTFKLPLNEIIRAQQHANQLHVLSITLAHVMEIEKLPLHHPDPYDRMLIAQARVEDMILVTPDPIFTPYSVTVLW